MKEEGVKNSQIGLRNLCMVPLKNQIKWNPHEHLNVLQLNKPETRGQFNKTQTYFGVYYFDVLAASF